MKFKKVVYLIFSLTILAILVEITVSKQDCASAMILAGSSGENIPVNDEEDCCHNTNHPTQLVKYFNTPVEISIPEKQVITLNLLPRTITAGQGKNYWLVETLMIPYISFSRISEIRATTGVFLL